MSESCNVSLTTRGRQPGAALLLGLMIAGCGAQAVAQVAPIGGGGNTDLACTLRTNCADSQPGSELAPLQFDGSPAEAMVALRATLATFPEAKIVKAEELSLEVVFTTPAGFQDLVDLRIDTSKQRIDYRSRSSFGLFDFGKNRSRMVAFAQRFERSRQR